MADGNFPTLVSRDRDANSQTNSVWVRLTDDTDDIEIGGGVEASALRVTIASDSTGVLSVDDNGGSLTVDGTVSIDSGTVTVIATDLDIRDLVHTQDSIAIGDGTSLTLDLVTLNSNYSGTAVAMPIAGRYQASADTFDDGDATHLLTDANGKLVISNPGGTEYSEDVATPATIVGTATMFERDDALTTITPAEGDWASLRCSAEGALWVQDFNSDAIAASLVDIETNTDFGAVVGGGVEATALRVTIANDSTGVITVDANNLDIRDLTHVSDSVTIGDGTETMNVTAAGEAEVDIAAQSLTALKVSKDANANTETNPIYVQVVAGVVSGNEIHDYDTQASLASDTADNHDYTVAGTTFMLKSIIFSCSGGGKIEVQSGPTASLTTDAVGFVPKHGGTLQLDFDPPKEVPSASTGIVRAIRTNREGSAQDVYSTIIGYDL